MAKAKAKPTRANTSARTKTIFRRSRASQGSSNDEAGETAPAAMNNSKKRKASNENDNEGSNEKTSVAAKRKEHGDRAPQPPRVANDREAGVEGDEIDDQVCWITIPKRINLFTVPDTWWMVDLHARPVPKQGATPLVKRCMRELGWCEAYSRSTLQAYRQFLRIKVVKKDWNAEILSPSVAVDQMWHQHLLDNANYAHDCQLLCGHFLTHNPDGGLDIEGRKNRLEATRQALLECYGEEEENEEEGGVDRSATGPWKEAFEGAAEPAEESSTASSASPSDTEAHASDGGDDGGATLTVRLRDQNLDITCFRVLRTTQMRKVFAAYARHKGVNVGSCRFLLDGDVIREHQTPITLELEDGDEIDTILEQAGC